jgi:hypothetical protein
MFITAQQEFLIFIMLVVHAYHLNSLPFVVLLYPWYGHIIVSPAENQKQRENKG